jgi:hypothetical protein
LRTKVQRQPAVLKKPDLSNQITPEQNRYFDIFAICVLSALGIYQSITFLGHQVTPSSDFICFVEMGKRLWSFQIPVDFKRLPALGVIQVGIAHFLNARSPELLAGWLLNAVLNPLNFVLIWLVARKFLDRAAI